eukprot:gene1941-2208_t
MASTGDDPSTSKETEGDINTSGTESSTVSPDVMHIISTMKASMEQTNEILATLMAERKQSPKAHIDGYPYPPTKRVIIDDDLESVASMNAIPRVAQTAAFIAAQTVNFQPAEAKNSQPAQMETTYKSTETQINHTQRSTEDDVLSLYGGKEFDGQQACDLEDESDNNSLLNSSGESLPPSEEQGPPISDQMAKIINAKFSTEFDHEKRKAILEKYKVPKNCDSLVVPRAREPKSQVEFKVVIAQLLGCTVLLGHVSQEMSFKRCDTLRPHLSNDYKQGMPIMLHREHIPGVVEHIQIAQNLL